MRRPDGTIWPAHLLIMDHVLADVAAAPIAAALGAQAALEGCQQYAAAVLTAPLTHVEVP